MNYFYNLEYSHTQKQFHADNTGVSSCGDYRVIAKNVPDFIVDDFINSIDKFASKNGGYNLTFIEASNEFYRFIKKHPKQRSHSDINVIGYNSFIDNIRI